MCFFCKTLSCFIFFVFWLFFFCVCVCVCSFFCCLQDCPHKKQQIKTCKLQTKKSHGKHEKSNEKQNVKIKKKHTLTHIKKNKGGNIVKCLLFGILTISLFFIFIYQIITLFKDIFIKKQNIQFCYFYCFYKC